MMIDRNRDLPVKRQVEFVDILRPSLYDRPRPVRADTLALMKRWRDNMFVERLWKTIEYKEVYLRAYGSVSEARARLTRYIGFYNRRRPHSAIGRVPPDHRYYELLQISEAA